MILRLYQMDLVEEMRAAFRRSIRRLILQLGTGGGKTCIFAYMTSEAVKRGLRVLIITHRSEILDQIDDTLQEFGITTAHIRSGMPYDKTNPVAIASIQTLVKRLDVVPYPDLVICDECHHCASNQWIEVFARYSKAKFVGTTATPERMSGEPLSPFFDHLVIGPPVQWLIDNNFLKKPIYIGTDHAVDVSGFKKVAGDYNKSQVAEAMDKKTIVGDAVAHYRQFGRGMPAITFCVNLRHCANVCDSFNAAGIRSETIDGKMDRDTRRAIKSRLESGVTRNIVSCELIGEGYSLPAVGVAILLRPTASMCLFLQQIGRALRPHPDQSNAIILDHSSNTLRHGPAEEPREWSLDGNAAKKRKKEAVMETRQCKACYAIFTGTLCPQCGTERESKVREIEVQEGQLREIEAAELMARRGKRIEEAKCRTFEDWKAVERARGYKNGWAVFRWKNSRYYQVRMHAAGEKKQEALAI